MTVYIVQKLDWKYDDQFYALWDDKPMKAFAKKRDAEVYRQALEKKARLEWQDRGRPHYSEHGYSDEPTAFFEVVSLELEP